MHAVPTKKMIQGKTVWSYRWREWVEITPSDYQKQFIDKQKKPRTKTIKGQLHYEKYFTADTKDIPTFLSREDAEKEMPKFEAKLDARLREREKRESWHDKYYSFGSLLKIYEDERKKSAKNSWDSKVFWFKDYVLPFFLTKKMSPNLEEWRQYFFEFKRYLETAQTKRSGKPISYASKNHCINELNYFLRVMWEANKCEKQPDLPLFSERLVNNHKGAKDLIPDDEFKKIYEAIRANEIAEGLKDNYFSDCYWVLRNTGLRINEILGIGIYNFRQGSPPRKEIIELLNDNKITHIYSYIFILEQPASKERENDGKTIKFKPLKGKLGLPQDARYIPITDAKTHDILRSHYNKILSLRNKKTFGSEDKNYPFFFDHVSAQQMRTRIFGAYKSSGMEDKYKSTHHTRHTKTTDIVKTSKGMSDELARLIVGHSKGSKTTQRYNLLYQEIVEEEMRDKGRNMPIDEASIIDGRTAWRSRHKTKPLKTTKSKKAKSKKSVNG